MAKGIKIFKILLAKLKVQNIFFDQLTSEV